MISREWQVNTSVQWTAHRWTWFTHMHGQILLFLMTDIHVSQSLWKAANSKTPPWVKDTIKLTFIVTLNHLPQFGSACNCPQSNKKVETQYCHYVSEPLYVMLFVCSRVCTLAFERFFCSKVLKEANTWDCMAKPTLLSHFIVLCTWEQLLVCKEGPVKVQNNTKGTLIWNNF